MVKLAEARRPRRPAPARIYGRIAFDLPAARADEAGAIIVALTAGGHRRVQLAVCFAFVGRNLSFTDLAFPRERRSVRFSLMGDPAD